LEISLQEGNNIASFFCYPASKHANIRGWEVKQLLTQIIKSQKKEIAQMKVVLEHFEK